MKKIQ